MELNLHFSMNSQRVQGHNHFTVLHIGKRKHYKRIFRKKKLEKAFVITITVETNASVNYNKKQRNQRSNQH